MAFRHRPRGLMLAVFLGLGLAGCGDPTGPSRGRELFRLRQAEQLWQAQDYRAYEFVFQRSCGECLPGAANQLRMTVMGGTVVQMYDLSIDHAVIPDWRARTIPDLFTEVRNALGADELSVSYHPTLGYPTQLSVDYDRQAVDDEGGFTVTDLASIPVAHRAVPAAPR